MEGLLPLVYKAIKKNKTRRNYECLSSGVALSDLYINDHEDIYLTNSSSNNMDRKVHRRSYSSVEFSKDYRSGTSGDSPPTKKIVRFGSQRMFSCVRGC
ncbi:uncharacterized protein LOC126688023 [Mercurialis annua]|uniref:uncharacterized protein LOC126688023 n=1 Tax=Mercurialis annua TaxID=3986 RepID=UPI00215EAD6F|nr:uncharacterized protein LOC126688023 [Mercurialis annua]